MGGGLNEMKIKQKLYLWKYRLNFFNQNKIIMKNTYLKFIFYFFVLLLLNVFSNDLVGNPNDFISEETSAMQEWECDCAEDAAECLVLCLDQDNCCCEITWEFEHAQPWPTDVPIYCKQWPNGVCHIPATLCNSAQLGVSGELCTSTFDYPNNPYYLRPSFLCLEEHASLFIHNPTSSGITLNIKCQGGSGGGQGSHYIQAGQFVVITLDFCVPDMFCSQ